MIVTDTKTPLPADEIITLIYESAIATGEWIEVLQALPRLCGGDRASLWEVHRRGGCSCVISPGWADDLLEEYRRRNWRYDPRISQIIAVEGQDAGASDEWRRLQARVGEPDVIWSPVWVGEERAVLLSVDKDRVRPAYTDADWRAFESVRYHLAAALRLRVSTARGIGEVEGEDSMLAAPVTAGRAVEAFGDDFSLTKAEMRVLVALCRGYSPARIAEEQKRTINSVRFHLRNIYEKTGFRSQAAVVAAAMSWHPALHSH